MITEKDIMSKDWNWNRQWSPRTGGRVSNQSPNDRSVSLAELRNERVLLLIGDPGSGKSTELLKEQKRIEAEYGDDLIISINSKKHGASDATFSSLWFDSFKWKKFLKSSDMLYVFVDGLDEFIHKNFGIVPILIQRLRDSMLEYPGARSRLRLRITSRELTFPNEMVGQLTSILFQAVSVVGQEEPGRSEPRIGRESEVPASLEEQSIANAVEPVKAQDRETTTPRTVQREAHGELLYSLNQLSEENILEAAGSLGIDGVSFVSEVKRRGFLPLSRRPKALKWLLSEFHLTETIVGTYSDIYWRGLCHHLADSNEVSDPKDILEKAARMAFVVAFSHTTQLTSGTIVSPRAGEPLGLNCFLEPRRSSSSEFTPFVPDDLVNLRSSGLFAGSLDEFYWNELPDMEFLAARYVSDCGLPTAQLMGLIQYPNDPKGRIVPSLANVAAQLSAMNQDVFASVLFHDPRLLISADSSLIDDESRHHILEALLRSYESGNLVRTDRVGRDSLAQLAFDGLEHALRPFILDTGLKRETRMVAIDICEACNVQGLVKELGSVVHSDEEDGVLRRNAAWALYEMDTKEAVELLSLVLTVAPETDEFEDLKGYALQAVWPKHWNLNQILPHITPPKSSIFGSYWTFLSGRFIGGLEDSELPQMYDWINRQDSWSDEYRVINIITESLLARAIAALPQESAVQFITAKIMDPGELDPFRKSYHQDNIPLQVAAESSGNRRPLVEQLISLEARKSDKLSRALHGAFDLYRLLPPETRIKDIQWIAKNATEKGLTGIEREAWFRLFAAFGDGLDQDWMGLAWALYFQPEFKKYVSVHFDAIDWRSPEAEEQKRYHQIFSGKSSVDVDQTDSTWFHSEYKEIQEKLSRNSPDKWYWFDQLLRRTPDGRVWSGGHFAASTEQENWQLVDETMLEEFQQASVHYLQNYKPICTTLGTSEYYINDQAAYRAMTLLLDNAEGGLTFLEESDWQRLGPVVLSMHPSSSDSPPHLFTELLQMAINHGFVWTPWVEKMVQVADGSDYYIRHIIKSLVEIVSNEELVAVAEHLISNKTAEGILHALASVLGSKLPGLVTDRLLNLLEDQEISGDARARIAQSALELFDVDQWRRLSAILYADSDLFQRVFLDFAHWDRSTSALASRLNDADVAILYRRLSKAFPSDEDINPLGMHTVTPRESVGRWRESLLDYLVASGTWEAAAELSKLAEDLPELEWLPIRVAQAEDRARQQNWKPHSIDDLLEILPDSGARIVRSNEQLQAVVIESLERLNGELQGSSPSAVDLWTSNRGKKGGVPKLEESLSDYIKRFLDRDFRTIPIFSNREVNNTPTQRNDILIEYGAKDPSLRLKVVCEVKGCWNPEIRTNMKTQLADQYLVSNGTNYGIFIVGFYDTDEWPPDNRKRHQERKHTLSEVEDHLKDQAREIATVDKIVLPFVLDCRLPWDLAER